MLLHAESPALSFDDLTGRLYDVRQLAVPPVAGERSGCVSTTDKAARYNAASGTYENWFANNDATSLSGTDKPHGSLCKLDGPGVIWRIWSAQPRLHGNIEIFIDGEKMPSTFGTGTEDYFGYAWGTAAAFDSALQAQVRNGTADQIGISAPKAGPGNIGHIVNLRWQVPDNVPFLESFEATIEKYHPNAWPLLNAYTVCWYQEAGKPDYYKPRPLDARDSYYVPAKKRELRHVVNGRYEGGVLDHMRSGLMKQASVNPQKMAKFGNGWSEDNQWLMRFHRPDGEVTLLFDMAATACGLTLSLTQAPDYGKADILLDGKVIAEGVDCYAERVQLGEYVVFPNLHVSAGRHQLTFKSAGKNALSKGILLGLDYLQLGSIEGVERVDSTP